MNKNYTIVNIDGMIGSGKSTTIELLKKNKELFLESFQNIDENIQEIVFKEVREVTSYSPYLKDFYNLQKEFDDFNLRMFGFNKSKVFKYYNKKERQTRRQLQKKAFKLQHIFLSGMCSEFKHNIDYVESDELEINLNNTYFVLLLDRSIYGVIFFTKYYRQLNQLSFFQYRNLRKTFNAFLDNESIKVNRDLKLYLSVDSKTGFERVQKRARNSEKTMSQNYYEDLYKFYQKNYKDIYGGSNPIIIDNNLSESELLKKLHEIFKDYTDSIRFK